MEHMRKLVETLRRRLSQHQLPPTLVEHASQSAKKSQQQQQHP
jgi:hypothetical protein